MMIALCMLEVWNPNGMGSNFTALAHACSANRHECQTYGIVIYCDVLAVLLLVITFARLNL